MESGEIGPERSTSEQERKFLVQRVPDNLEQYDRSVIRQGYMAVEEDGSEIRLRDQDGDYTLTYKSYGGVDRGERTIHLSEDDFEYLWPTTAGRRIEKIRYYIPIRGSGLVIELDRYAGKHKGLFIAEVEFFDTVAAYAFEPPDWFGADVSQDQAYKNRALVVEDLGDS